MLAVTRKQQALSNSLISTIYRSAVESYFQDAPSSADAGSTPTGVEHYLAELQAIRLKHLKFVLTEKIQEASRHDGIFPHGSEKHHVLLSLVNSDDEKKMRDALTSVQDSLFNSSVNDAMMRFARQAALSAKAKIAEQAAHQHASSRGSLLATTRQLLSRSGGGSSGGGASTTSAGTACMVFVFLCAESKQLRFADVHYVCVFVCMLLLQRRARVATTVVTQQVLRAPGMQEDPVTQMIRTARIRSAAARALVGDATAGAARRISRREARAAGVVAAEGS